MIRFFKYLVIAPLAILFLIFAFANRQWVVVSFDPFTSGDIPAFSLDAPLFIVIILSIMLGVLAGGFVTWVSQGRHRRALRQLRADADKMRSDLTAARDAAKAALPAPVGLQKRA